MRIICTLLLICSASYALGGEGTVIGARQHPIIHAVADQEHFKQVLREAARGSEFITVDSEDLKVEAYSLSAQKIRVTDHHGSEVILVPADTK